MDVADLVDIFQAFGPVRVKRMFGGHGVYRDTLMFALEVDGTIFLKADDSSKSLFEGAGARPFAYAKQGGRTVVMSFWSLPDAALDDPAEAARWAELAFAAARRAQQAKMQRGMKPKPKAGAATRKN
ncbi:TfoX/Sxy family protein [Chelatococcus asaccharovorans]|uniref:TfoX/Sxy family protein n=1 Tax=Chelatococcus asaccharovorans TaxID=28210 RepID=UPI00224C72AE|nr:TfoX/Sxy family protein [Chelatococcus asaccharovorans]CAH1670318.1 DNA transformation protein [Chelatococcus asaccharovorans]CAH1678251.1 DNA transformation protein [Chelatococcus asaccharovorans]